MPPTATQSTPSSRPSPVIQDDVRSAIVAFMPRLRRFAFSLCGSRTEADDLVQSTVERALARLDQWAPDTRLEAWLCAITRNLWIDETRRRVRRGPQVDIDEAFDLAGSDGRHTNEMRELARRAAAAFLALPEESRALASLVILNGASYREAAKTMNIPIGTVMSRVSRIRQALRDAVEAPAGVVVRLPKARPAR